MNVADYIKNLNLEKHIEGGYFKEIYRSSQKVDIKLSLKTGLERNISSLIWFLLEGREVSKLHRLKSDEIWHYCDGSAALIHIIDNGLVKTIKLGNKINKGDIFYAVIPAGKWFCAEVENKESFTLVTCTVTPGFDYNDFELAVSETLKNNFPNLSDFITRFC